MNCSADAPGMCFTLCNFTIFSSFTIIDIFQAVADSARQAMFDYRIGAALRIEETAQSRAKRLDRLMLV